MLPPINLAHLKYFSDAARTGSISEAAKKNFVSQSAISQGIQKLESALGIALIIHQRQRFQLTEAGSQILEESQKIFKSVESLYEKIGEEKGELFGEVKFACTNAIAQFFLPDGYLKMKQTNPKAALQFHRGSMEFIHRSLKERQIHFALALNDKTFADYETIALSKGLFKLYCSPQSRKASLKNGILVDHIHNAEVMSFRDYFLRKEGRSLEIKEELSGWGIVASFVLKGAGIGLLPQFVGEALSLKELRTSLPGIPYEISAILPKKSSLNRASKTFLDMLRT